ncbi:MAG: rnr [Bacteriovoracaceae bacterium]|nr:rnr [Bacteriovoracaceae bacterium]
MKKRKLNFIVKNTSNTNDSLKSRSRSIKKTQNNQTTILGWIDRSHRRHSLCVLPFQKDFSGDIFLRKDDLKNFNSKLHTIVRVSLKRQKGNQYEGRILEAFPSLDDPGLEMAVVQEAHGFPIEFSEHALKDAEVAQNQNPGKRTDLTRCTTVTIDGETAKDFDDAISVEKLESGNYNLKVSIADVSHFVTEGTALDREAYLRGTSIYFPDRCVPMLPEVLSNNLCSLVPHEPRFTLTCEMEISPAGKILKSFIYPSIIKSAARLTYTTVASVIQENKKGLVDQSIEKLLKLAFELSLIVRKARKAKGGLDLDLPEAEMKLDKEGNIVSIGLSERNEAHKLIEDFMILANEAVSEAIEKAGYSSIFRVHENPDPLKIEKLKNVIKQWGFILAEKKDLIESLQAYLESVRGHENEKMLVVSLLRSLKQAQYSASNAGHFGLGSESYTHFTSPIRRYPDLMVHRILRKSNFLKSPASPYPVEKLDEIAKACSESERRAFLAERDMEDLKKVRFMQQFVGKSFDGVVTTVKNFGCFVEILPHFIEGLIPIRLLPHDFWQTDELEISLYGRRSKFHLRLGDRIRIQVSDVDRLKRQITFRFLSHLDGEKPARANHEPSQQKKHFRYDKSKK